MRKNSMTKCAVGAMLFGGTLGLAQAASAAVVTFLNTGPGAASSYSYLRAVGSTLAGMSQQVAGFAAGSISKQNTTNTVVLDWTAPVPAGVFSDSITMKASRSSGTVSAGTQPISANFYRTFTVTGGSAVWQGSLASNGYVGNLEFQILLLDPTTGLGTVEAFGLSVNASGNEVENFSGTLAAGTYSMYTAFGIQQSTSLSTFATFSIPAPGAVALLGAAGLIGARRRRD